MPDDMNEHFFACSLLRWSLRVSLGRFELMQAHELVERVEGYDDRFEELGGWLMDELVRAGPTYLVDGQKKGISSIDPMEIQRRFTRALESLEELASSAAVTDESRAYCVYVAECSWVAAILRTFVHIEQSLSSDHVSAAYRGIADELTNLIAWIEAQRDEVASQFLTDSLGALSEKVMPTIDSAAQAWRDEVRAYSARFPRS